MTTKKSKIDSSQAFKKDLLVGQEVEKKLLASIQKKYPTAVLVPGKFKPYDIYIPENDLKVEIKADFKSKETGNILIELMMFGEPSALLTTEADFWIFDTGDEIMVTTPSLIMECIMVNNVPSQDILGDGDSQKKRACLIPIDLFKKYLTNS